MNTYTCKYCHKQFIFDDGRFASGKMSAHTRFCEKNPKRQYYIDCLKKQSTQGSLVGTTHIHERYLASLREYTFICEHCGKEYKKTFSPNQYQHYLKLHHFCSSFCSHARVHTPKSRSFVSEQQHHIKNRPKKHPGLTPKPCALRKTKCIFCGVEIYVKTTAETACYNCRATHGGVKKFLLYDSNGHRTFSEETKKKISEAMRNRVEKGLHKGWTSRKISSYPERFWKKVLDNNNISYNFNFYIPKTKLGVEDAAGYFLDFALNPKIDLEIDGKQHEYDDRLRSDSIRNSLLIKNGWNVYRVKWNEINSDSGKEKMNDKIQKFLAWYYNLTSGGSRGNIPHQD